MKSFAKHTSDKSHSSGSALLVTLLVVSLLLVMVLSLVVVVRMELRKVVAHQELMQARANARLGLQMAIAKLQVAAGPDTRVTAPAYTGDTATPNILHISRAIDSAAFRQETGGLRINPRYGQTTQHGSILGYFLSYDPDAGFNPQNYNPFNGGTQVEDGHVLLVGPGSVNPDTDSNGDGIPDGYVAAPTRSILAPGDNELGQFAYWIADNGQRAQINLTDPLRTSNTSRDRRSRAATVQGIGHEGFRINQDPLLAGFDPTNMTHHDLLRRTVTPGQIDLTPFTEDLDTSDFFHDMTLQSLGLPVNVRTGGFKRDLTAVIQEAEGNGGQILNTGPQWQALIRHQAEKMQRWRDQTLVLEHPEHGNRPSGIADHDWNAMNAITLRDEQNNPTGRHSNQVNDPLDAPPLREKIFPPMSDLDIRWDPGGASWRQLLTYPTMKQRLELSNGSLSAGKVSEREKNITPVVARFALSYYFTMDWPTLRFHSIPVIVLWNPYSEPLSVPEGHHWQYKWEFQTNHFDGFGARFAFRNPAWNSGNELWTPRYMVDAGTWGYGGGFRFRLLNESGNTNVVIPPGEAVFFTMHEHSRLETSLSESYTRDWGWTNLFVTRGERFEHSETNIVDLRQGLHGFGGYSFYIEHNDMNDRFLNLIARGPRTHHNNTPRPDWWPGPNGNWNEWDSAGFPFAVSDYVETDADGNVVREMDGLWAPFGPETHGSDYPVQFASNAVEGPLRNIAINEVGFDPARGWEMVDAQMDLNPSRADFRSRGMYLRAVSNSAHDANPSNPNNDPNRDPWVSIPWLYMRMPQGFTESFTPWGQPLQPFIEDQPLSDAYPGFPIWGTVWGLRMPDPVITMQGQFNAPSRWLIDYNPTAPYQIADPIGRTRAETHRGGHMNPASYIGGFSQSPNEFNASELSANERNQAIGLSDDFASMRFPSLATIPRLVIYDVPENSDDITSIASFMHARPHSIAHAWAWRTNRHNPNPTPLQPRWFAAEHDTGNSPGTDYAPSSPAYPIGNSFASVLVPRHRSQKSYYPGPMAPATSPESIPYAQAFWPNGYDNNTQLGYPTGGNASISFFPGYDTSYIYNKVLWDDFFVTSRSNNRLRWLPPYDNRDYHDPERNSPLFGTHRDFNASAGRLQVEGAFNVNSTSVPAWSALLASMLDVDISNQQGDSESSSNERAPFSRFLNPVSNAFSPDALDDFRDHTAYSGFRRLSLEEIEALAEAIVEQVKLRGPFLSLADFVNRQLIAAEDDVHDLGLAGALQTAINNAGLNDPMGTEADDIWMRPADFQGSWRDAPGSSAFFGMYLDHTVGTRTAGSPGYLLQSDLLARIGSVLTARSDTFTIRAYGELNQNGNVSAKAWLEATVQRMPDFTEPFNPVTSTGNNPEDMPGELSALNQLFGRQFKVISFRWLNEEEI
jgi:hypothetical protein